MGPGCDGDWGSKVPYLSARSERKLVFSVVVSFLTASLAFWLEGQQWVEKGLGRMRSRIG